LLGSFNKGIELSGANGFEYKPGIDPIFVKFEHAVSDGFGIGINYAYASADMILRYDELTADGSQTIEDQISWSNYSINLRFNYHIGGTDKLDPYLGFGAGCRKGTWAFSSNDGTRTIEDYTVPVNLFPLGLELTFGARYMFTPYIGAYAELGVAKAAIQAGLTGRF